MKVDLGQCAVCSAKNSKYVEKCYKCGAILPWSPVYVAPKSTPQKLTPQPIAAPNDAEARTVVIAPADDLEPAPIIEPKGTPAVAPDKSGLSQKAQSKVSVPAWALVTGGFGLLILGMALWAILDRKPTPTPVIIAPTPIATPAALAPIVPTKTAQSTPIPTAETTAMPAVEPTIIPTAVPVTGVITGAVAALEPGPTFDEIYANLTAGTAQQQELYWNSVKGKKISWRGEFVSLGSAATGPLVVNCKGATGVLKVTIHLNAAAPQTLPKYMANQSVPFEGVLESYIAGEVMVKNGHIN